MNRVNVELAKAIGASPALLDALPIAVIVCDQAGDVVQANRRARAMAGAEGDVGALVRLEGALAKDGRPLDRTAAPVAITLTTGKAARNVEAELRLGNGPPRIVLASAEPLTDAGGQMIGVVNSLQDVSVVRDMRQAIDTRARWSQQMFENLPVAFYLVDAEGRLSACNQAARTLWGREPKLGEDLWCGAHRVLDADGSILPSGAHPLARVVKRGEALSGVELACERPDGSSLILLAYPLALTTADGTLFGGVNMLVDITERKSAADRQKVLMDELNHRVKNSLAAVQSLALHSFRGDHPPAQMREAFEARLMALSAAHGQLARTEWRDADFGGIAEGVLAPHLDGGGVTLGGPAARVGSKAAVGFAMTLSELASNAARHGALSVADGAVRLYWTAEDGALSLDWRESGGPPAAAPAADGFGLKLLRRVVERELGGRLDLDFATTGLVCRILAPRAAAPEPLVMPRL